MSIGLRRTASVSLGALAAAATLAPSALGAAPQVGQRTTLRGSTPRWAQPGRDRGDATGSRQVTVRVYLPLRDTAGAEALVEQVTDPDSASYGAFLTPEEFRARFAPSDADVAAVQGFLSGAGLKLGAVPANHHSVAATGTLAQAEAAFGTDVHEYAYRGKLLDAPSAPLTVPAAIAGKVLAVTGLDQSGLLTRPRTAGKEGARLQGKPADTTALAKPDATVAPTPAATPTAAPGAPPPDAFVNAPPCSTYFGEKPASTLPTFAGQTLPYAPCGYVPSQFQSAYGIQGVVGLGLDGRGQTVAITDAYAAPTILDDANTYATRHGQKPFRSGQFKQVLPDGYQYGYDDAVNGDQCGEQGWYGEETLDVEAVHAMAPGANITYVASPSCDNGDFDDTLNKIVDGKLATIVTNSWGSIGEDASDATIPAYEATFIQAAATGIGMFFSSGDAGDDSADTEDGLPATDYPSTNPYVTAVGGTALGVDKRGSYSFETGWVTGTSTLTDGLWPPPAYLYGGGGGTSEFYAQPSYQKRVVPPSIAKGRRATPDISMDADPQTGMLVGETQTFLDGSTKYSEYRIGGTSLASPLYAGMEALADQIQGRPHGFANPAIYRLNKSFAVHDIAGKPPVPGVVRVNYTNGVDATDGVNPPILRTLGDESQSLHVAPGWDNLTGVGTPNGVPYLLFLRTPRR